MFIVFGFKDGCLVSHASQRICLIARYRQQVMLSLRKICWCWSYLILITKSYRSWQSIWVDLQIFLVTALFSCIICWYITSFKSYPWLFDFVRHTNLGNLESIKVIFIADFVKELPRVFHLVANSTTLHRLNKPELISFSELWLI